MGITQDSYVERQGVAINGQIANTHTCDVDTFIVATAAGIGWGLAVARHNTRDGACQLGMSASNFLGITVKDPTRAETGGDKYVQGAHASVLYRGDIWVEVVEAVTAGAPAFANGGTGQLGVSGGGKIAIPGGVWQDDAATGGLARLRLAGDVA